MLTRHPRTPLLLTVAALSVVGSASPAHAYPSPGQTIRVSIGPDGSQGDSGSWASSLSADGRLVAFASSASNLVADDTNGYTDVFVYDRGTERSEKISVGQGGVEANGSSDAPAISPDGRFVAFQSEATNIGGPGGTFPPDIHLHDRQTGTTTYLGKGWKPSISTDGSTVVWDTYSEIKVWDRATGTVTRADVDGDGVGVSGVAQDASVSADGRIVAFHSSSSVLAREDQDVDFDVFVHDRETGETELVSISSEDEAGNSDSWQSAISGDGRFVAFWSYATNFVPNQQVDLQMFVHDRVTERTELVSIGTDGRAGDWWAWGRPAISHDGRYVAFRGGAENLVPNDGNGTFDVFVHDRVTGTTELVGVSPTGSSGIGGDSSLPAMTPDGRYVSFSSAADLVDGDDNGLSDVFVRDMGPALGIGGLAVQPTGGAAIAVSGWASLAGSVISSASDAPNDSGLGTTTGGEITRAGVTYRPEAGDLLVRVWFRDLVGVRGRNYEPVTKTYSSSGLPGSLYGFGLRVGSSLYELRVSGATEHGAAVQPRIVLFRCDAGCVEVGRPMGGLGTAGAELRTSLPLAMLGAQEGAAISELRAFTAFGEVETGVVRPVDELLLPAATIPRAAVTLGLAPAGSSQDDVSFDVDADLEQGRFTGSVPTSGLTAGTYDLWAKACLGESCGERRTSVQVG